MNQGSVLQDWLSHIPIRMQSTLVLGLRGPDSEACPHVKKICRWLRGLTFKPGNPGNYLEFMGEKPPRIVEKDPTSKELSYLPQHFWSHLMHALEVVGYVHPEEEIRERAQGLYIDLCNELHVNPESYNQFWERLKTIQWPGGVQPDNFREADQIMKQHRRQPAPCED